MSTTNNSVKNWIPEIMYEDDENGLSSKLPFIVVPEKEEMPKILFIFECRDTGEFEPGLDGEELPITEMDLHQYADMLILKNGLRPELYDEVRKCLGLEPVKKAAAAGRKITDNVRKNLSSFDE